MGFWDELRSAFSGTSAADKARASMPAQAAQAPMPAGEIPSISLAGKPPAVVSATMTDIPRLAGAVGALRNPDLAPGQKELRRRPPALDGLAEVATTPRGAVVPAAAPKSEKPPHGLPDLAEVAIPLLAILRPMFVNAERVIRNLPDLIRTGFCTWFATGAGVYRLRVYPRYGEVRRKTCGIVLSCGIDVTSTGYCILGAHPDIGLSNLAPVTPPGDPERVISYPAFRAGTVATMAQQWNPLAALPEGRAVTVDYSRVGSNTSGAVSCAVLEFGDV